MDWVNGLLGNLAAGMAPPPRSFEDAYKCLPMAFSNKENLESGNKIILPSSALQTLTNLNISFPMQFRVTNPAEGKVTHCGVMEFSAPEEMAYVPFWMMQSLGLKENQFFFIKSVNLEKGKKVVLQPHETRFTELSNPRAVLERSLRDFSCLSEGDTIEIKHGPLAFKVDVVECFPKNSYKAISLFETDLQVEFEPPKDYDQYLIEKKMEKSMEKAAAPIPIDIPAPESPLHSSPGSLPGSRPSSVPSYFDKLGPGHRVSGKAATPRNEAFVERKKEPVKTGIVNEDIGKWRYVYKVNAKGEKKLQKRIPLSKVKKETPATKGNSLI